MVDVVGKAKVIVETVIDKSSLDTTSGKIGAGLKTGALVGVAALGTLAAAGVKSVLAFEDAESVSRKLNNVLANMGKSGAAEAVDKLATSIERKTGIDDEQIKRGETLLATFSEVAKSAGELGGNFERATQAAVDMSEAGFGSVESASVMLGKALQDPVRGVTALSRAGVTFTADQKKVIKSLVDSGEAGKAQALILKEVERQVKGTAEAGAKGSVKLQTAIGEAEESIGGLIADLFDPSGAKDGKGGKKKSFLDLATDATYDFSKSVSDLQKSKDWKELKSDFRTFGGDVKTVAGALATVAVQANKLSKQTTGSGLFAWFGKLHSILSPLGQVASFLREIADLKDSGALDLSEVFVTGPTGKPHKKSAHGGRNMTAGLSWVGEEGPELISVPSGADIYSNRESMAMAGTSASTVNNWIFNGPESLSQARRTASWYDKYGTRFGAATAAGGM